MKLLITDDFFLPLLNQFPDVFEVYHKPKISYKELSDEIKDYDVLIISTRIKIDSYLIDKAINLKLIIRLGIGVDHINLDCCKKNKIIVCNTPNSNISSVVELVFGQIIRNYRNLEIAQNNLLNGDFRKNYPLGKELRNKTIGIIGVGRIGSKVAKIAKAFEMNTIGFDPYLSSTAKKKSDIDRWSELNVLLSEADIVTLHVPFTSETKHMINKEFLSLMRKNSILINCSRGKVADFEDVIEYSKSGKISKFIFDVFEEEPLKITLPDNILKYFYFSPHIGALTEESLYNRSKEALELLNEFLNKKRLHGKIDFKRGY